MASNDFCLKEHFDNDWCSVCGKCNEESGGMITAAQARKLKDGYMSPAVKHFFKEYHVEEEIRKAASEGYDFTRFASPIFHSEEMLKQWIDMKWPTLAEMDSYLQPLGYIVERKFKHQLSQLGKCEGEGAEFNHYCEYIVRW